MASRSCVGDLLKEGCEKTRAVVSGLVLAISRVEEEQPLVDVGFSPLLDPLSPTIEGVKYLHLDAQVINALFSALSVEVFNEVCNLKNTHEMWTYLQDHYEMSISTNDDCIQEWMLGEECSTSNSDNEESSTLSTSPHCFMAKGNKKVNFDDEPSYDELMLEKLNEYLGKEMSKFKVLKKEYVSLQNNYDVLKDEYETLLLNELNKSKVDIGITCDLLDDMPCVVANPCISSKVRISTSCDDSLDIPYC